MTVRVTNGPALEHRRQWMEIAKAFRRDAIPVLVCPNCDGETCVDCRAASAALEAILDRLLKMPARSRG